VVEPKVAVKSGMLSYLLLTLHRRECCGTGFTSGRMESKIEHFFKSDDWADKQHKFIEECAGHLSARSNV
jgi:hypothetical protein